MITQNTGYLAKFKLTQAENFPTSINFGFKDYLAIFFIPLILLNGYIFAHVFALQGEQLALADGIGRAVLFILICCVYKTMLVLHWQKLKLASWQSWLLIIIGAILLQVIIGITRSLLPIPENTLTEISSNVADDTNTALPIVSLTIFIIALIPVFTALIEDIVFRYTLLNKLFINNILWRIVVVLANAILFGLIHYHNFNGDIVATISFMMAGLFLNLIYIYTKNIWHVLLIHGLNNFVLSVGGLVFVWIIGALTA